MAHDRFNLAFEVLAHLLFVFVEHRNAQNQLRFVGGENAHAHAKHLFRQIVVRVAFEFDQRGDFFLAGGLHALEGTFACAKFFLGGFLAFECFNRD